MTPDITVASVSPGVPDSRGEASRSPPLATTSQHLPPNVPNALLRGPLSSAPRDVELLKNA
eukprot:CAMPEP_0204265534 /NCGR_PEP_ID=MMETSP0468-20130131/9746_1 /ASSEMBLY_ACC=CAM_ASM_000383 /TAXON_ID=2969 /ORGANISM="Oxyrrhis marina" /LENGTH=60 /DNA_ID=CAMNT_0051240497 /DNA_START=244 /DNA_END=423 /DNA_ORIENTATION=-